MPKPKSIEVDYVGALYDIVERLRSINADICGSAHVAIVDEVKALSGIIKAIEKRK